MDKSSSPVRSYQSQKIWWSEVEVKLTHLWSDLTDLFLALSENSENVDQKENIVKDSCDSYSFVR